MPCRRRYRVYFLLLPHYKLFSLPHLTFETLLVVEEGVVAPYNENISKRSSPYYVAKEGLRVSEGAPKALFCGMSVTHFVQLIE